MSIASAIAVSGMNVATLRLQVSARNVANSLSDGFVPSQVVQVDAKPGTAASVQLASPGFIPAYIQKSAEGDAWAFATNPYAQLTNEMVQELVARFDLTANAQVFRADVRMQAALLYAVA